MRFSFTFIATLAAAAIARASGVTKTRQIVDVCATIDAPLSVTILGVPDVLGLLDVCLCLSALPLFLQTNVLAILAESLVGEADITAILTALIESSPHVPACPSGGGLRKRDFNYWEKHASCPSGLDACGVFGGSARAFECVDTRVDLESCGGCAFPINPNAGPAGQDCTAIHGVSDVACVHGQCVIRRCMDGFEPSIDGSTCLKMNQHIEYQDKPVEDAFKYGLEHIPTPW